ncbi:MAG: crossover junction endodeoxyribonuclease RuvC [Treponemataceae bacterium]|nr:MAG: crossover junction endodeoxyribonuclease RuvC [Treponemataceae bacterium]
MTRRRVIGIDPGLSSTGYAVLDFAENRYTLLTHGVIETQAHAVHGERLLKIYDALCAILREFSPEEAGIETLFFSRNVTSALAVSEARGVVTMCLTQAGIKIGEYSPNIIKQAVSGNANADKKTVQEYTRMILGLREVPKPDHAADAIAAAITQINSSR